ncbi:MAG TPA: hypothetical protein VGS41_01235 [Chthonomonadales bacterium]|nr:hypothetical protein [Chthonomonadales bacterium]
MADLTRGIRSGYPDDAGNEWIKGPNHHSQTEIDPAADLPYTYERDVQPSNGTVCNVPPQDGPMQPVENDAGN